MSSFKKIDSTLVEHTFPLTLYRSEFSGCKVVIVDYPSAMLDAQFSFSTMSENNFGLAHTLEHLIFQGSKNYPYSDLIGKLVKKAHGYSNGFTYKDSTTYVAQTVGAQGFLKLMPVYLDCIMNPVLTASTYTTEVHHITGEGKDAGVVYSEMSARDDRVWLKNYEMIFGKDSPFALNSGGSPKAIREGCSLDLIKNYHQKYYKMENMVITIVGAVNHAEILQAVADFEMKNNFAKAGYQRPYENFSIASFEQKVGQLEIPARGQQGDIYINWKGPNSWGAEMLPMSILLNYYDSGPESLLQKTYVNIPSPVCASVFERTKFHTDSTIGFRFYCTNAENLKPDMGHVFAKNLLQLIKSHDIDLKRLHDQMKSEIDSIRKFLEGERVGNLLGCDISSNDKFPQYIFEKVRHYQNYAPISPDCDDVNLLMSSNIDKINQILTYGMDFWKNLVEKYFTDEYIMLYSIPNKELIEKEKQEEDQRIAEQIDRLGPEGLTKCAEIVEMAAADTIARSADAEILNQFGIPGIENVTHIPVERSISVQDFKSSQALKITHKTDSNFVSVRLLFDGRDIPSDYYPLVKLYTDMFNLCSVSVDGNVIPCEIISPQRKAELASFILSSWSDMMYVELVSTKENLHRVPYWVDLYLNKLVFEKHTIEKTLKKMIAHSEELKRHDSTYLTLLYRKLVTIPGTVYFYSSAVPSATFYKKLLKDIETDELADDLIKKLTELKGYIARAQMNVHLIGNADAIDSTKFTDWPSFHGSSMILHKFFKYSDFSMSVGKTYCIAREECTSSYLCQMIRAEFDSKSIELVYSQLLNQYFNQVGSILYSGIRSKGLAYHASLTVGSDTGITLNIYKASDMIGAYNVAEESIIDVIKSNCLDAELFETAKRTLTRNIVNSTATMIKAGKNSFSDHMDGVAVDENLNEMQIQIIKSATPEMVLDLVGQFYVDLFDESKTCRAIVTPPSTRNALLKAFPEVEFLTVDDITE